MSRFELFWVGISTLLLWTLRRPHLNAISNSTVGCSFVYSSGYYQSHSRERTSQNLATGARLAIDLIKHDPIYERAVQHACGNTIICDSTQIARHVVYEKGNEVKAVSLDGTVIHKGGNMSGGVTGLDGSRKFDDREVQADISRLEANLAFLKDDLLASETTLAGIAQAEIDAIKSELKALEEAQSAVNRVEDKSSNHFQNSSEQERLETTVSKLQHQIDFETEQLEGLAERQATIQSVSGKTLKTLESVAAKKLQVENEMKEIDQEISKLSSQLEELVQAQSEKSAIVSEAKKESSKVIKVLDATLRDIGGWNDEIERLVSDRLNIFRRCKLESISLPILEGSLRQIPMEEAVTDAAPANEASSQNTPQAVDPRNHGIKIDYARLDDEEKENPSFELEQHFVEQLARLNTQIEAMVPRRELEEVENRLRDHDREFEAARKLARATKDEFTEIRNKRVNLFNKATITSRTRSMKFIGTYLELDDFEEPYLHGIKYSTMPPGKRYRDVEQLSGGEKTMAALALLFAIHRDNDWGGTKSLTLDLDQYGD
ncbi:hypothetical protein H4Q26_008659 [Puccinia striiformis f. sp. tritici PST-130]|nr:hypothetical protein H4Q26_008659 [Puccinia striiformis f. sp. tritici PST-130]